MSRLDRHFADYAAHHQNGWNKATHTLGIPMIVLALFGLASRVVLLPLSESMTLDLGLILGLILIGIYLAWHPLLAIVTALICIPLYLGGSMLPTGWLLGILAVGVGLQYLGHLAFEGKNPAFHRNLIHTLVGPLWMVALLASALGLYRFRQGAD